MDNRLLDLMVCPVCKGPLIFRKDAGELVCRADRLAYPIRDGAMVMLEDQARKLEPDEEIG